MAEIPQHSSPAREVLSDALLAALRAAVGDEHLRHGPDHVEAASRTTVPWRNEPIAYAYPSDAAQVQQIVRLANEHKVPIYACSKGKNWGYGSASPVVAGGIVLVLERMDTVVRVDEELAYAVVQPGVTYRQLNDHLKQHHPGLWCDCTDSTPEGSVIGNAMEKGVGETPYGDHFGNLCGLEVVLPDGQLMRTGGGPETLQTRHTYKWGTGPYIEGLFAQSNYGIVTQAGIWLMPKPQSFCSLIFSQHREEDFPAVIDAIRTLSLKGVVRTKIHMINDFVMFALIMEYPRDMLDGRTHLSTQALATLRKRYGVPPWSFMTGLYGSPAQIREMQSLIKKALSRYGRIDFMTDRGIGLAKRLSAWMRSADAAGGIKRGVSRFLQRRVVRRSVEILEMAPYVHELLKGIPTEYFVRHAYFMSPSGKPTEDVDPARDGCGKLWFAPIAPVTGRHITAVMDLCRPLYESYGFDYYAALLLVNPRSMVVLMAVYYQRDDFEQSARALKLYEALCEVTLQAGYQQYRTSIGHMDPILACDPVFHEYANRIKSAVDPNNIIAPGRYGLGA